MLPLLIRSITKQVAPQQSDYLKFLLSRRRNLYTRAIVRAMPDSFVDAVADHATGTEVNLQVARQQLDTYIHHLKQILPNVTELPALPEYPDSVFVEDTTVVIGNRAVLMHPGHETRRGEVDSMEVVLRQLGVEIVADMRQHENCHGDGGDILFTGSHLFVGLSNRTNIAAARILEDAFGEDCKVLAVPPTAAGSEVLHLKSVTTLFSPDTLILPKGPMGDAVWESLPESEPYTGLRVPDVAVCNVVLVNDTVLVQATDCDESRRIVETAAKERNLELIYIDTSEHSKKDAALSCCSVLLSV